MPSSSVTSLTTTNSINTTTPITTKTTSTTQQKLRHSITKIVVEKSLNGGSTPTSSISNISDSSPGTSNAAIVQVLQNSTDAFPSTQSCGFILSAADPTTTTLIGQQQNNNNILTTKLIGQQQNNNILQTTLGKQIVASVIGQSQSSTTTLFQTGITTDSPIFDVLQQQERLERNENITKTKEQQQNGAERSFPLLQNGVGTLENGFVSENDSKLVKNELKVVRDYLSTASTSTTITTTSINGIKNETEQSTKRFQNPQLILTKTLLNNGANIRFGPNHVFTSRSFIRAGLDSSLKYQVWAGISFLGRFLKYFINNRCVFLKNV